jgi:hypothetical protein
VPGRSSEALAPLHAQRSVRCLIIESDNTQAIAEGVIAAAVQVDGWDSTPGISMRRNQRSYDRVDRLRR